MPRYKVSALKDPPLRGLADKYINFVIEYTKDFNDRRAAEASGFDGDDGHKIRKRDDVDNAIAHVLTGRLEACDIDAEWALMEAVDNMLIAKQTGKLSASNTALRLIFQHAAVDALSAEKIHVVGADEIVRRLKRGRERRYDHGNEEVSFL